MFINKLLKHFDQKIGLTTAKADRKIPRISNIIYLTDSCEISRKGNL